MEQFLLMLVGLADTMVVSYAGEAAVSGVSLVNSFNTIFINLFTALASGGAVVVSQYIGINVVTLLFVFLFRNLMPFNFMAAILATAVGLSLSGKLAPVGEIMEHVKEKK